MTERLIDLLLRISRRERLLLTVLGLVVIPVALVFAVVLPLAQARSQAMDQLAEARTLRDWVGLRTAELASLASAASPAAPPARAIGISGIDQSLRAIGLGPAVTRLANRSDGEIDLAFDKVDFALLAQWLDKEAPAWGYELVSLEIDRGETPGEVKVELVLRQPS